MAVFQFWWKVLCSVRILFVHLSNYFQVFNKNNFNFTHCLFSVSSSSLESELDDPIMDSTANLLSTDSASPVKIIQRRKSSTGASVNVRRSVCPGGTSSTHSLNEADLQVIQTYFNFNSCLSWILISFYFLSNWSSKMFGINF